MTNTEDFLLSYLRVKELISDASLKRLTQWWETTRDTNEDVAQFLHRRGIVSRIDLRNLEAFKKGFITGSACFGGLEVGVMDRILKELSLVILEGTPVLSRTFDLSNIISEVVEPTGEPDSSTTKISYKKTKSKQEVGSQQQVRTSPAISQGTRPSKSVAGDGSGLSNLQLQPGVVLGKCMLTELIGKGGNGVVFRALHQSLNVTVAIKVLRSSAGNLDPVVIDRLRLEAQLLARLNHPNVVRILDFETDPLPYIVLEHVEGLNCAELIEQSGRVRVDRARELLEQACQGLKTVGELGIVHRDIKPANLLLTRQGILKVADFGLAFQKGNEIAGDKEACMGTAAYIAPEQVLQEERLDFRADMYSLGATFYHAITGRVPFTGNSIIEIMMKRLRELPIAPIELVPEISVEFSQLIMEMLSPKPMDRPLSFDEIITRLKAMDLSESQPNVLPRKDKTSLRVEAEQDVSEVKRSGWKGFFSRNKQ